MKYVLDTNVVKRLASKKRNSNVDAWLATVSDNEIYMTVFSIQETHTGIELLKRNKDPFKVKAAIDLETKFEKHLKNMEGRILDLNAAAAKDWGRRLSKHGTKNDNDLAIISIVATEINAVAVSQNLIDFRHRGITLINPYDNPPSIYTDPES